MSSTGAVTADQRTWAAILAAGHDRRPGQVCLGGVSALVAWGLRSVEPDAVHIVVAVGHHARVPPGVTLHRTRVPPDCHAVGPAGVPATWPGRALLDAAHWARSDAEARLFVAACFQQGLVTVAELERAAIDRPNTRRLALVRRTASDCAGGSHSLAELDLVALCRRARLPVPARQVTRYDRRGRRRYLDAVFEPWRVAVEVDGAHHLDVAQMWDDTQRGNALELDGYTLLRYPAHVVRSEPGRVAAELREALRRAGWS
jgi:very-short-patch-repair endonuclease